MPPAASGAIAVPAVAAAPTPIKLLVNWAAVGAGQVGIWVAYEGGFGREQGPDLELTNVTGTARSLQAAMQGELHLTMVEPAAAMQISVSGVDAVMLFGAVNRLTFSVMTQPGIPDGPALRGKALGITRIGSATHSAARVALQGWGLVADRDVALRQLGDTAAVLAALEAGQIDGAMLNALLNLRARRAGYNEVLNLGTQGADYTSLAIGGLRAWVAANQEAVRRYACAYAQGIHRFKIDIPRPTERVRRVRLRVLRVAVPRAPLLAPIALPGWGRQAAHCGAGVRRGGGLASAACRPQGAASGAPTREGAARSRSACNKLGATRVRWVRRSDLGYVDPRWRDRASGVAGREESRPRGSGGGSPARMGGRRLARPRAIEQGFLRVEVAPDRQQARVRVAADERGHPRPPRRQGTASHSEPRGEAAWLGRDTGDNRVHHGSLLSAYRAPRGHSQGHGLTPLGPSGGRTDTAPGRRAPARWVGRAGRLAGL